MDRLAELKAAERQALHMLDCIEERQYIRPGRQEREVERDIRALAAEEFGIERHWHKRIVRAGCNTLATAGDNPAIRTIGEDDMVFLDLGPVFGTWEADVGRSYAVGTDPRKQALVAELPVQFDRLSAFFRAHPDISGAQLYAEACASARAAGWDFGGSIAGHIVGEFPHVRLPGPKQRNHISPENPDRMRDPDLLGQARYWILEIHLVDRDRGFGGFYERLMIDEAA